MAGRAEDAGVPQADASAGRPVIAMSTLGRNGRFGNQLFQYAFLRIYARRHGLQVRVPDWIGRRLYGHYDPPVDGLDLPILHDEVDGTTLLDRLPTPVCNVDLCGYFQYHTSWYRPDQACFRTLFQPTSEVRNALAPAVDALRAGGRTVVGVHIRRGDFAGGIHFTAPTRWYTDWLSANWDRWNNPVLLLATDDPARVAPDFARFSPVTSDQLGAQLAWASYYPDHYLLGHCDVMAISNSSFSFSAAMLNERAGEFVRPIRAGRLVSFDPWDSEPCLSEGECDEAVEYYARTHAAVSDAVVAFRAGRPAANRALRRARRELADLWLGLNDDTLVILYNTVLADAQRLLLSPGIHRACLDRDDQAYAAKLKDDLEKVQVAGVWGRQYLLAAMLYWAPGELRIAHDLAAVPRWLECDYIAYLRTAARRPV